jgi:hypothetical protein
LLEQITYRRDVIERGGTSKLDYELVSGMRTDLFASTSSVGSIVSSSMAIAALRSSMTTRISAPIKSAWSAIANAMA